MAIWAQVYGTDLWSAAVTKINNVIGSYNNWSGGSENQRKVKASATDFDTAWCDPEGKINSATSFNLGTIVVGDSKTIALPYHSYSAEGNIGIKAYSLANPLNYIIGNITAIPDNQNITVTIVEKGGSGTQTDMVVVPYFSKLIYKSNYTDGVTNLSDIFSSVNFTPNTGTTWGNITAKAQKNNGTILINVCFDIRQTSGSLTDTANILNLTLSNKYRIIVEDDYELIFPVSIRIINNTTLAYIRSEISPATTLSDASTSTIRVEVAGLVSNERQEVSFTIIAESYNKTL